MNQFFDALIRQATTPPSKNVQAVLDALKTAPSGGYSESFLSLKTKIKTAQLLMTLRRMKDDGQIEEISKGFWILAKK